MEELILIELIWKCLTKMTIDWKFIVGLGFPTLTGLVGWILRPFFEKRPNLVAYFGHIAALSTTNSAGKKFPVFSHSVIIRNSGKLVSKNIRVKHKHLPDSFEIYPPQEYSIVNLEDGYKEIVVSQLIPKQQITISYLYFPPVDVSKIHDGILSDEGFAKVIDMIPTPQLKKWQIRVVWALMAIGVLTCLWLIYKLGLLVYMSHFRFN